MLWVYLDFLFILESVLGVCAFQELVCSSFSSILRMMFIEIIQCARHCAMHNALLLGKGKFGINIDDKIRDSGIVCCCDMHKRVS